jgi:hypothetical protein
MFSIRKWRMAPFLSTTSFAHPIYHLSTACEFLNRASPIAQTAHAPGVEILFSIAFFVFLGPRLPSVRGPSMVKGDSEGKTLLRFLSTTTDECSSFMFAIIIDRIRPLC